MNQFVDHAFFHFNDRRIVIQDEDGYTETVQFEFSEDGAEGFQSIVELLQDKLDSDQRTYCFD